MGRKSPIYTHMSLLVLMKKILLQEFSLHHMLPENLSVA